MLWVLAHFILANPRTHPHAHAHHTHAQAIAWCPWQLTTLATGGGTGDKNIHFWNSVSGAKLSTIPTGSQVTSLVWSKEYKELLSSHGFPHNQLSLWSYPTGKKITDLPGHDCRVLHTSLSPDGQTVVSGAADENLKFWSVFESRKHGKKGTAAAGAAGGGGPGGEGDGEEGSKFANSFKKLSIR
jgi:WD40 repeat protein